VQTEIVFGIPPFPQKKAERMGHGSLWQKPRCSRTGHDQGPLQVRWPAEEVKDAKLAAIRLDYVTVSNFMPA
jgi:hypothetical protein